MAVGTGYFAVENKQSLGEWWIVPIDYWEKHHRIKDGHANLKVFGMEEVADHTYRAKREYSLYSERELLMRSGFTILDNPVWYYQLPGYNSYEDR